MKLVKKLGDHVYKDVASGQIFTTIAGLAKMLSVNYFCADSVLFSCPRQILNHGIFAGAAIVESHEENAKEWLARMALAESEIACSVQPFSQTFALMDAEACAISKLLVYISSHLAAKIILDSDTASSFVKGLAQSLFLTNSLTLSEEFLRAIDDATSPVSASSDSRMQLLAF